MDELLKIVSDANGFLWGTSFLIPLLCGTGLYFTLRLGFVQITKFGTACRKLFGNFSLFGEAAGAARYELIPSTCNSNRGTGRNGESCGCYDCSCFGRTVSDILDVACGVFRNGHEFFGSLPRSVVQGKRRDRANCRRACVLHFAGTGE